MKTGQIVIFCDPHDAGEAKARMRVVENNGDRVLVATLHTGMFVDPTQTLRTADLTVVEPNAAEYRMALEATLEVLLQATVPKRLKEHTLRTVEIVRAMLETRPAPAFKVGQRVRLVKEVDGPVYFVQSVDLDGTFHIAPKHGRDVAGCKKSDLVAAP